MVYGTGTAMEAVPIFLFFPVNFCFKGKFMTV